MNASRPVHSLPQLQNVQVASPCSARWEDMKGDDRVRYCSHCSLHVHNLSSMSTAEAEQVLHAASDGGRVCARFYRRADGTVLTQDCPVGLAAVRARVRKRLARIAAALGLVTGGVAAAAGPLKDSGVRLRALRPIAFFAELFIVDPAPVAPPPPPMMGSICMGDIALPPPTPPAPAPIAPPTN